MTDLGADLFNRVAADYDRSVPFFATFGRRLVDWISPNPGTHVLDLGAGRGAVTAALLAADCSVLAGDASPAMLDFLRETLLTTDTRTLNTRTLNTRILDAHHLDLPDSSFDLILSGFLLHILDTDKAFTEIARVLKPGGVLAFSVPGHSTDGGWWATYGRIVDDFTRRIRDVPHHEPVTWPERADRAGLRHVDQTTTEVSFPIDGPEAHWSWLMSHGNRWLHDALPEPDRTAFRDHVLRSLREHHPTNGTTLIAGAEFHRVIKP
ncbi:class I SAM-dependent methyltransferase [Saccharothrix sp. NRRL B-16348]|uniref:class I SAM-dependent methyltransferase n=1 Tax=Saccharothrix sp. NRRL B-16348 TaxID=1415542 RepID=UPI0006AFB288|nr:methyltransferase domain-containing protein [Saccharothrix sp. NRRL B-16348]